MGFAIVRRRIQVARARVQVAAAFALSLVSSAGALAAPARLAITIVRNTDPVVANRITQGLERASWPPVDIRWAQLPVEATRTTSTRDDVETRVEGAHAAYLSANFGRCLSMLGTDDLVAQLIADDHAVLGSRVLLWRVACHVGANEGEAAERDARSFARYGFELPSDIDRVTPEVGAQLSAARRLVAAAQLFPLALSARVGAGSVLVDAGSRRHALPCKLTLPAGDHLIRFDGDGFRPEWRIVQVGPNSDPVELLPIAATPSIAASQWLDRYAGQSDLTTASSLELLSIALSARRLVMFTAELGTKRVRLRAAFVAEGRLVSYSERLLDGPREVDTAAPALLRELLETGGQIARAPPIVKRPAFWIGIAGGALVAAGATLLIVLYPRTVEVRF